MSKHRVIVKRLNAIHNIGAMDLLCTDKTGTLTIDKIVLAKYLNVLGDEDEEVLKWAYLNSYHQTGLVNLMDKAVLEHVELNDYLQVDEHYKIIDEIPFDFQRRRMSVILKQKEGKHLLICKGAVEEMLDLCTHSFDPGEDRHLHIENDEVMVMTDELRKNGLVCRRAFVANVNCSHDTYQENSVHPKLGFRATYCAHFFGNCSRVDHSVYTHCRCAIYGTFAFGIFSMVNRNIISVCAFDSTCEKLVHQKV